MAYAVGFGALVALVCALLERGARLLRLPVRMIWAGGIVVMALSAAGAAVPGALSPVGSPARISGGEAAVIPAGVAPTRSARLSRISGIPLLQRLRHRLDSWDRPLRIAWVVVSALLALLTGWRWIALRRHISQLETRALHGGEVCLGEAGPAAFELGRPAVLLPFWALELGDELLALVLRHEREHPRAHDPGLLMAAALTLVLVPWQLPLWWSWRRLRFAIELDCDARVLRTGSAPASYVRLLLLTAQRAQLGPGFPNRLAETAAPLRPIRSQIARRVAAMTSRPKDAGFTRSRAAMFGGAAIAIATLAAMVPVPRKAAPLLHQVPSSTVSGTRAVVHLTALGLFDVMNPHIAIYATGAAAVGIGGAEPVPLTDTLRLDRLPAITADVTDGVVHIVLENRVGHISVGGKVTGGPAADVSASGRHIVLLQGGVGIQVLR